jgi:DNA sulfur modification protein DndB
MKAKSNQLNLPCLRGKMGDWMYYVTLLKFDTVARRVFLPEEIDEKYKDKESLKLGDWIQRDLENKRIKDVVDYIQRQEERFFNSLILGLYDGKPSYREIEVSTSDYYKEEEEVDYFSKTFGILSLNGDESIFAIDGQHRAISIRRAVKKDSSIKDDEICVIFVAHKTDVGGKIRTRRLFSTLNRYAKPVNKKEIIALSEDDNCAILTRRIVENYSTFRGRILINGNKSINVNNKDSFTSIIQLYDIIVLLLCDIRITSFGLTVGQDKKEFTNNRNSEKELEKYYNELVNIFNITINSFSDLKKMLDSGVEIDRNLQQTSLIFRPIGQEVFFNVLKAGMTNKKTKEVYEYFSKADFSLKSKVWNEVFWDSETNSMITTVERKKYAYELIMEKIGIPIKRTAKGKEIYTEFGFNSSSI